MHKLSIIFMSSVLVVSSSCGMENQVERLVCAIEHCAWKNNFDTCKTIIEKNPDVVHARYPSYLGDDFTPLHIAVEKNNIPAAQLLLTLKASVNAATKKNCYTPLHMVRTKKMAKLLLAHGADLKSRDSRGETPLCHVLFKGNGYNYDYYRPDVYQRCDLAHYLFKHGAVVDDRENSALHRAVSGKSATIVEFLLERGANPESKNIYDMTPIEVGIFNWGHCNHEIKAFENCRIVFLSERAWAVDEWSDDSFELLKDGARKFKTIMSPQCSHWSDYDKSKIENMLANFFMVIQRSTNDGSCGDRIITYDEGYMFKDASFADLENWVGKESIDYVKNHLKNRCQGALSAALNGDYKKLREIVQYYPFVLAYDKKIAFDVLNHVMMSHDAEWFSSVLNRKADLSGMDGEGNGLLHRAITCNNAVSVALFINNNINLLLSNSWQKTPIDLLHAIGDKNCIDSFYNAFADKFFATYSYQAYYQEIKKVLNTTNFNINFCDKDGKTLLHRAAESHPEKCSILLKNGAIVTQRIIDSACSDEVRAMLQKKYNEQR